MTAFAMPATRVFTAAHAEFGMRSNTFVSMSPLNQAAQSVALPGAHWTCTFAFTPHNLAERAEVEGWLAGIMGQEHRITMSHPHPARRSPRGTMRGTPTLSANVAQLASVLPLANMGAGATVLRGDLLGCGGQLFMVTEDATASGGGAANVKVAARARTALAQNSVVTWDAPTTTFMLTQDSHSVPWEPGMSSGFSIQLVEVF